ncbi:hypothetical protein K469DRAFT_694819 [Zopfia rhizophila CBS 207.26]|uniref:Uncharacterized protein n=1 Tax=Zopfia rhizophila CBS 207.26 TaxID=1314779 RepID=A0A6A6EP31_9PEZI|nr:hypothetical protein K469DRAFT_694819 [Zopfia rhizophila CBS 207.26]
MAKPGLAPVAPSSRQDVISALLNDYGNSFGRGDTSPYAYSPVPTLKELPPPPPGDNDKPLPPVMMRFQLRVDEPRSHLSYNGDRKNSLEQPTKILSRSISRSSKPPSLRLAVSNGSTAALPATPASSAAFSSVTPSAASASQTPAERPLPRLPPPPPEKSQLRNQPEMGNRSSKESVNSQGQNEPPRPSVIKRKAVPAPGETKRFPTLADLSGPRGRKVGPKPATSVIENDSSINVSLATQSTKEPTANSSQTELSSYAPSRNATSENRPALPGVNVPVEVPPTPEELPSQSLMQPPKPSIGLPSRPAPRRSSENEPTPTSAKHFRGKSSTGFDIFKASKGSEKGRPMNTITPSPTPSPTKTPAVQPAQDSTLPSPPLQQQNQGPESPVSPMSPGRRPFSFEPVSQSQLQVEPPLSPPRPTFAEPARNFSRPGSPVTQSPVQSQFPGRPQSPAPAQTQFPPRTTSRTNPLPASEPQPQTHPHLQPQHSPTSPSFTPSYMRRPKSKIAPILPIHTTCYHSHARFHRSSNRFAPMACMLCHTDDKQDKWSCTWCSLRICAGCRGELEKIPNRSVSRFLERKKFDSGVDVEGDGKGGDRPGVVVWESGEGEGDD